MAGSSGNIDHLNPIEVEVEVGLGLSLAKIKEFDSFDYLVVFALFNTMWHSH